MQQHLRLLKSAGEQWDLGNQEHVIGMVTALRVLLVDRLLDKVIKLKSARMVDSAIYPPPGSGPNFSGGGLTVISISEDSAGVTPICNTGPVIVEGGYPTSNFHDWWERDLAVRHGTSAWTRKFLVYEMANTDAIHYDDELDQDYRTVAGPVPGWKFQTASGEPLPSDGVAEASLRQIAWEVAESFSELA
ncbi:hypothetical protein BOWSER_33 [Gordonia phage Bowser]|uniref:Uncharacterized protein n=1 Tax=Gordonia phage Bowser TaxID=1838063 RepID=A0A160DCN2_9CAUD|nr:hypothetical protein BH770_gp33 [Gordonia phage Bowser]ANA85428.1 hypothetical protein BOWSER_33 [Gordonia phage Bowser]